MPWYRRNSATHPTNPLDWVTIANLYRKNSDGNWIKIRRAYRKNSATGSPPNEWVIVHDSGSLTPYVTTAPTLTSNYGSDSIFEDGDTITLTRGTWANTGSVYAPISYSLKIQYSSDNINWTDAVTGTGTSISYTISLVDVRSPSYYFRGRVTATNVNGSSTYNTAGVLSNMYLTVDSFSASIVNNQIYSTWTLNKSNNSSNIFLQTYSIVTNSTYTYNGQTYYAGQTVYETTVPVGTSFFTVPTGTNIKPGESHYAKLVVTANDTIGSEAFGFSSNFLAPFIAGTISITPSFDVLDGYRRVESGSTVTATPENWPSGTTFTYEWYRSRSFSSQDDLLIGTGSTVTITSSSSITGERIWVSAYPTYSNGQTGSMISSNQHRIIPAPPAYTLGGGGSSITITSLTAVGGEYYYGTYSGPTSGSIPTTLIGTDYTIPDLSTGTYTVTLYSGATNGSGFSLIATASNTGTSLAKSITALTPPTPSSVTYSDGTFTIYFSGGSGQYYQVWYNTSSSPGTNNPTSLGVTSYDFNGSSSPISWTPSYVGEGVTYNFWIRSSNSLTTTTPGEYSAWSTAYVQATPPAISSLTASDSTYNNKIELSWSGGVGSEFQIFWTTSNTSRPTDLSTYFDFSAGSSSPYNWTGMIRGTKYYFFIRSKRGTNIYNWYPAQYPGEEGRASLYAPGTPTGLSASAISSSRIDISWTAPTVPSPNPSGPDEASSYDIYYSTSSSAPNSNTTPSTSASSTSAQITGLSSSTLYYFWVRAKNADNTGASASNWSSVASATTSTPFTTPTCPAPSWGSGYFQRTSTLIRWFTDYPTPSGSWSSITGMQFEIRTTAGGGTLLASGTRSFPGFGVYPYAGGGTIWAFRCGTSDGDISYSSSARFARARVVMLGTNGSTYYGDWTAWY